MSYCRQGALRAIGRRGSCPRPARSGSRLLRGPGRRPLGVTKSGFAGLGMSAPHPERAEREFGVNPAMAPWLERAMAGRASGEEAGISRLYSGIHWPIDHVEGNKMGKRIGRLVVKRAQDDGTER